MNNIFFFQTQQITDNTILFNELKQQNIFFSYFQVDQNYYRFVYAQKSIDINLLYQAIDVIQELGSKQRKIRSFRGFFLYALEIIQMRENYEILKTNLQFFFLRKVKTIIRQNQKATLLEFLFGKAELNQDQIKALNNQVDSLQQKIIQLESKLENPKYALRGTLHASDDRKNYSAGSHYTLEGKKAPYLTENYSESKTVSEEKITSVKPFSGSQQYNNISSNQEKV